MFKRLILGVAILGSLLSAGYFTAPPALAQGVEEQCSQGATNDGSIGFGAVGGGSECSLSYRISEPNGYVAKTWRVMRSLVNIVLILALLLISFSNIARINIDTYAVKKALPNLVIGIILANASMFIARYLADISTVTIYFFVELAGKSNFQHLLDSALSGLRSTAIETAGVKGFAVSVVAGGALILPLFYLLSFLVIFIGKIWLAILLYFRLIAIYLLVILAPLAFVSYGIPGLDKYFKMWWQQFIKMLFMLTAMSAVFWLMTVLDTAVKGNYSIASVATMAVLLYFALSIPTKLGGEAIKFGDKAARWLGGRTQQRAADLGNLGARLEKGSKFTFFPRTPEIKWLKYKGGKGLSRTFKKEGAGKFLQVLAATGFSPTSVMTGYKKKTGGDEKAREYRYKQSPAYRAVIGDDGRFLEAHEKQTEDMRNTSAQTLVDELKDMDSDGDILTFLQKIDPSNRSRLLSSGFNALVELKKLDADDKGFDGDMEKIAKYLAVLRLFERESRRDSSAGVQGAEELVRGGYPYGTPNTSGGAGSAGGAGPYGAINLPEHLEAIRRELGNGAGINDVADRVSTQFSIDRDEVLEATKNIKAEIELEPHIKHFGALGAEEARKMAELGADLNEEFEKAFEIGSTPMFEQVVKKGLKFMQDAGYTGVPDFVGKEAIDQAAEMQNRIRRVTGGAHAVASGQTAAQFNQLDKSLDSLGRRLEELAGRSGASPEEAVQAPENNQEVTRAINDHVTERARVVGANLSPEQVQQISNNISQRLVGDLTQKRTLKRIFSSEAFRQNVGRSFDDIAQLIDNAPAPTPQPVPQPPPPQPPPTTPPAPPTPPDNTII